MKLQLFKLSNQVYFANKILSADIFVKGKLFLSDLTAALVWVGGAVSLLCIVFTLVVSQVDALEEWQKHSKKVRKILIIAVIIFLASGLYTLLMTDYFGFQLDLAPGKTA